MRFVRFMNEDVTDALEVNEPEVGKKYSDEYVSKRIDIIQAAIKKVRGQKMNDDAKEAIMADLNDKLDKWENVDKETKPPIAGPEAPPETIPPEGKDGDTEEGDTEEGDTEEGDTEEPEPEDVQQKVVDGEDEDGKDTEKKVVKKKSKSDSELIKNAMAGKVSEKRLIKTKIKYK